MSVTIYGKDSCPYTSDARDHYAAQGDMTYVNVKKEPAALQKMLELTNGRRVVPVIVDAAGAVTIGFGGT